MMVALMVLALWSLCAARAGAPNVLVVNSEEKSGLRGQFIRQHISQESDPYDRKALDADQTIHRQAAICTRDHAPATPKLTEFRII
jgi:hypothetical protein